MAEETPVTYEDLNGELKKKYDEVKVLLEADLIGSFHRTRSHGIRWKGFSPEGALDGVDLSTPSEERTRSLRQEINFMVAHSLHRHSESLVNTLERVALRVIQEIMSRQYSPSGPALGTHQGELPLQSRPPLPFALAAPEAPNSSAYVVYKIGGDPSDYQFLHDAPKEIPHGYTCAYVPDCSTWALSNQVATAGTSGTTGGTSEADPEKQTWLAKYATPTKLRAQLLQLAQNRKNKHGWLNQFGMMPKRKTVGYTKPYPNEYELIPLPPKYRLPDFTKFSGSDGSSSIEHGEMIRLQPHPKLSTPPDTGGAHTPPLRRHAVLPSYLMASSAAEPPPPPPPPPGGGEGSASTRSRSTPVAVEFVYPSGVPPLPVSRGEDWESEGSNAWIPSGIDPALAFRLVVRLDSSFTRDSKRLMNGFYFPAVVATTISLRDLKANIFDKYSWSSLDAVHFEYFNSTERRLVPLISDDDLGILFALNASCHFGKIRVHVDRGQASSGVGASSGGRASCLSTAAASANSVRRGDPCRSTAAPSVPSASGSQIVPVVNVEDDAEIGDQSPEDDEDELMFPELVDRCSKQAMEDQYMEDIAFGARFDETDDEEKNENDDSLVLADYEGEDLPTIEWNRENPQLAKGTVFQTMMDCRNAITTYHILTKNNYEVIKSEPDQAGAENAEENEAAIQLEIEAAVQHEEIEAANAEEIEAAVQHEEIEAANAEEIEAAVQHEEIEAANAEEIEAAVQHEEIEPMDREQREQMDVEWLQPMSPEESQQYYRHCLDSCKAMCDAHFEELMAEEKAEASQKKKNKKEGKRKVDTGNIPGRVTRSKVVAPASHTRSKKKILF
ncbi:hypothetical protein QYE76_071239 [Lolium multiflorum]|uniref:Uncharacterized protein n=1 Tax=Lolium multiflorum TaxID=4521 RepID=A0AAD8WGM7_LOLMU|nr:hypothetical protein QYE76_071239 [Lolium multiflorum]